MVCYDFMSQGPKFKASDVDFTHTVGVDRVLGYNLRPSAADLRTAFDSAVVVLLFNR